jgi:NTE family protein
MLRHAQERGKDPGPQMQRDSVAEPISPVESEGPEQPEEGIALCLSGGGYRAMLFHVGSIWRLNELGYLPKISRVSSVSGGSITAATLGLRWGELDFAGGGGVATNLRDQVVEPIRALAGKTIDVGSILTGFFTRGTVADKVTGAFRKHLFDDADLQQLPDEPRFVINATNLQTGSLWRFSKPYMADYQVGMSPAPRVELAVAVAASSAFPPVLSPLRLKVDPGAFSRDGRGPLHEPPFTSDVVLSDGGVYDNLGLETAWKRYTTILISDGGGQLAPEGTPKSDWPRHAIRVVAVIDNQVRNLRKRQAVAGFRRGDRRGTYWGIRSHPGDFEPLPPGTLPVAPEQSAALARTKTRLKAIDEQLQERLINRGYAICDVAMRRWVEPGADRPQAFPYPERGLA